MKPVPWEIEAIATHVPKGTSERSICPKCSGGSDNEKSLMVYVDHDFQFHWKCYRATCGYRGGKSTTGLPIVPAKREPRFYTRPYVYPTPEQHDLIQSRFGLPAGTVDGYSAIDDRFILKVFGTSGLRGHVAYSLSGAKPKSLTYNERPEEPFVHYTQLSVSFGLVIVEDWFSAEKVAEAGGTGVALMGTNLSQAMVTEIAKVCGRFQVPTFLAFDLDAYSKALSYQIKFREQFPYGLKVWKLRVDLKYEPVENIKRALRGETNNFGDFKQQERI